MSARSVRGSGAGRMVQALHQVPVQAELRRPALMQGMAWVMVCWGAYMHAASSGGDRAIAVSGRRRIMPPHWAQVRGASMTTGGGSL